MADYSKTPLVQRLGLKANMQICILNSPKNYQKLISLLPKPVIMHHELSTTYDFIHFFTRSQEELREEFPKLKGALHKNGLVWISWPKGSCAVRTTDLNDNIVRQIGLENGLVDVKIVAVDEEWSGIKFIYRLKDRKS